VQSVGWANGTDVLLGKQLAFFYFFDGKQRASKLKAIGFARTGGELHRAKSFFRRAHRIDHCPEFRGLQGESAVWSAIHPPQTKMFLNDARSERHSDHWSRDAHGVIGKADGTTEAARQFGDCKQVRFFRWSRVGTCTFQQRDFGCAGFARRLQRFGDFIFARHARRHDQRLTGARHFLNQPNIHQFKRRHLVRGNIHLFEKIDGALVECARKQLHPEFIGNRFKFGLPVPRRKGLQVKVVQKTPIPKCAAADAKTFLIAAQRDRVGCISLQLDRIGTRVFRRVKDANRLIEILIVIGGKLGDDVTRLAASNLTARKLEGLGKLCFEQNSLRSSDFSTSSLDNSGERKHVQPTRNLFHS
jgi:hypothetical protein